MRLSFLPLSVSLALSVIMLILMLLLDTAIGFYQDQAGGTAQENAIENAETQRNILSLSRGVAFILLFLYAAYVHLYLIVALY